MFGGCAIDRDVPGYVANQDRFVVHQILAQSRVCPAIEEVLEVGNFWPVIWKWDQDWLLDVVRQIASWLDLGKSVVESSGLGHIPQGVDKVVGIPFDVEVMFFHIGLKPGSCWMSTASASSRDSWTASLRFPHGCVFVSCNKAQVQVNALHGALA